MAASLKLLPGSTVRWRGRRYLIVDYESLDAIIARQPRKQLGPLADHNRVREHQGAPRQISLSKLFANSADRFANNFASDSRQPGPGHGAIVMSEPLGDKRKRLDNLLQSTVEEHNLRNDNYNSFSGDSYFSRLF